MGPEQQAVASFKLPPGSLKGTSLIITGEIDGLDRRSAEKILIDAGAKVEKSLNKKVQLVVLGENAGAKKLEKTKELGIETENWDDLVGRLKGEDDGADEVQLPDDNVEEEAEDEEAKEAPKSPKSKTKVKANTKAKIAPVPNVKTNKSSKNFTLEGKTVIITGTVPGHDRRGAKSIVEEAGAEVARSLNKQVELVILGTNPGPDKMSKVKDLGIETIHWNDMAERLGLEITPEKAIADVDTEKAPDSIDGTILIITGTVDGQTRQSAQKLLESAGAKIAKSLNKAVELVVLGTNPGPEKLNKIADLSLPTCSWGDLIEELGLDDEASKPPRKKSRKA